MLQHQLDFLKQMLQHQLENLKQMLQHHLENLKQMLQHQLNTKIGFSEELSKLHQELKNPQEEYELRVEQLEEKMAQLNREWRNEPES
jgi:chaperonin cofactor prefoldin